MVVSCGYVNVHEHIYMCVCVEVDFMTLWHDPVLDLKVSSSSGLFLIYRCPNSPLVPPRKYKI